MEHLERGGGGWLKTVPKQPFHKGVGGVKSNAPFRNNRVDLEQFSVNCLEQLRVDCLW